MSTEGGSCDPKLNTRVANVLEDARAKSIPKTTLTEYLKKLVSSALLSEIQIFNTIWSNDKDEEKFYEQYITSLPSIWPQPQCLSL